jgi:hypothetical protein
MAMHGQASPIETAASPVVVTLVRFPAPPAGSPATAQDPASLFASTAPRYLGIAGLRRKVFLAAADGSGGGIYEWESRAHAERWFTPEWFTRMHETYGATPALEWFEAPCIVDAARGRIMLAPFTRRGS